MFYYITSNLIPAINANSVQIISNCDVLHKKLDADFQLLSPETVKNMVDQRPFWKKVRCIFRRRTLRYFEFALKTTFMVRGNGSIVYTRDILVALLHARRGIPVYYEAHSRPGFLAEFIFNHALRYSNFNIVCVSNALKTYLVGRFFLNERRLLVAHDGVFLHEYLQSKPNRHFLVNKFDLDSNVKIILHTGSLYPGRGSELFGEILDRFPNVAIVHIGGTESVLQPIRRKLSGKNFHALAHLSREELVKFQVSCDVLLLPVLRSTKIYWCFSPMKMFEYMASGVPIVCSKIGSITEVLTDADVFFFEPEEPETLFKAIENALNNSDRAHRAQNSLEKIRDYYTWDHRAASILEFINRTTSVRVNY